MPDEPEVLGLLALLLLTHSRRRARSAPGQPLVLLPDQDRSLWDRALISEGQDLVRRCLRRNQPGPYQIQAAIAAVHSDAPSATQTDWRQILALYDQLMACTPTAVVALNRAIALAEIDGPAAGLAATDGLDLGAYYLFHAVRADLLRRLGRTAEAAKAYGAALDLTEERGRARVPERSEERLALAAVGRHGRGHGVAVDQVQLVEPLAQLAGLRVPEPDPVADPQVVGGRAEHGRLHLAGALGAVERQPGRQVRAGQAARVARPRGDVAAAEHGDHAGARPADDRQREQGGRPAGERAVGVEQARLVQPGARADLGDRFLGRGGRDRAGAAAVDELDRSHRADRGDDRRPALSQLGRRPALHGPDRRWRRRACPAGGRRPRRSGPRRPSARPGAAPAWS